jgi:SAM-dependent methyltransferase
MATDIGAIIRNLITFYNFMDKTVLHVGAGGGQLVGYATGARHVLAVDPDPAAVDTLRTAIRNQGLAQRIEVQLAPLERVTTRSDVVFFEFCLHEIADPAAALAHAQTLAPELLILDHEPDSPWAWFLAERDKLARSWAAVRRREVRREAMFMAFQHFERYDELLAKAGSLGEPTLSRIREFEDRRDFTIGMDYRIALVTD